MMTARLMKIHDAATYLGMSVTKLKSKGLPVRRDGGNVLYDRLDLDDYADNLPYDGKKQSEGVEEWQKAFD